MSAVTIPTTPDLQLAAALEERLLHVWPAVETIMVDGWAVRFAHGYSGRANSASAITPGATLDRPLLRRINAFFASHRLPTTVRLSPVAAPAVRSLLEQAGFVSRGLAHTMIAPLDRPLFSDPQVALAASADDAWIIGETSRQEGSKRNPDALRAIVSRLAVPACFASIPGVGFGMAAIDRGWVEIGSIMIDAASRGSGYGRALVTSLLAWGRMQGAGHAFLQVDVSNAPALALYRSLGFTVLYDYDTLTHNLGDQP